MFRLRFGTSQKTADVQLTGASLHAASVILSYHFYYKLHV